MKVRLEIIIFLLDQGVITQEEFNKKKKELLDYRL